MISGTCHFSKLSYRYCLRRATSGELPERLWLYWWSHCFTNTAIDDAESVHTREENQSPLIHIAERGAANGASDPMMNGAFCVELTKGCDSE